MGLIHIIRERKGDDAARRFKEAVRALDYATGEICNLAGEMEDEYGYGERAVHPGHAGYAPMGPVYRRDGRGWDEMDERRYRDGRGRYM